MLVKDLLQILQATIETHPEAADAQVWADSSDAGYKFQVRNIVYATRKGQPKRIILED